MECIAITKTLKCVCLRCTWVYYGAWAQWRPYRTCGVPPLDLSRNVDRDLDNSYPKQLVPRTTRTQDNSYPGQLVPKTTRTQDNSYPGQLVPKTTRAQDNSYPGQLVPKTTRTHVVWYDMKGCDISYIISYIISYHITSHHFTSHHTTPLHTTTHHTTPHHTTPHPITSHLIWMSFLCWFRNPVICTLQTKKHSDAERYILFIHSYMTIKIAPRLMTYRGIILPYQIYIYQYSSCLSLQCSWSPNVPPKDDVYSIILNTSICVPQQRYYSM